MSHLDNLNGQHPKRLLKSTTWLVPAALLVLCVAAWSFVALALAALSCKIKRCNFLYVYVLRPVRVEMLTEAPTPEGETILEIHASI